MNHETTFCITNAANILHHIRAIGSSLLHRSFLQQLSRGVRLHEFGDGNRILQRKELVTH